MVLFEADSMTEKRQTESSIETLYADVYDQLLRFVRGRVRSAEAAEDLAQEAFLKLLRRLEQGEGVTNVQAYLFRTARNLVIDHYRTRKESLPPPELADVSQEEEKEEESRRDIAGWMGRFISYLPSPYRETLFLSELQQLPYAEIAARLGVTVGAVKSRVHRGRELLRERLITCCRFLYDARGRVVDYEPHHWNPTNRTNKEERSPEGSRSNCSGCD